jgi:hypothetical protein
LKVEPKTRSRQGLLKRGVVIAVAVIIGVLAGLYLSGVIL